MKGSTQVLLSPGRYHPIIMSQELITENPDILAYQALSRHLFTVFSQGPGGINGIKFSVTDPKHKEWLVKAEETFAKQTEIKPVGGPIPVR